MFSNMASPLVPGTPTNTPATLSPCSPHLPHDLHSPLLWFTVPPNSPEALQITEEAAMSNSKQSEPKGLDERLAELDLKAEPPKEETPKAPANEFYEVRSVPGKGYGCYAKKAIKQGTRILSDDPLLVVPVASYFVTDIKKVFDKLTPEKQALYFTLHSAHGQDPKNWPKQVHPSVEAREHSRINEQHEARTGKEASLVSIFQTNCMEVDGGAGIFPHAARFNHSCCPNAAFAWNKNIKKETIHAMRDIDKGEQITLSYCDAQHDLATRRWELKHYGFVCDCPACSGDETDTESIVYKSAERRYRLVELEQELEMRRSGRHRQGKNDPAIPSKLLEYIGLLREGGDYTFRLANAYLDLAEHCEGHKDWKMAKLAAYMALKVLLIAVGPDFETVKDYKMVLQRIKKKAENAVGEA